VDAIELINVDRAGLRQLLAEPADFERTYQVSCGRHRDEIVEVARLVHERIVPLSGDPQWWGYFAVLLPVRSIVGMCGFKGPPDANRTVEIGYGTMSNHQGRGYATIMARKLVGIAFATNEVDRVIAHTLPEPNASTRVLGKVGFRFAGEVMDPEDGRVWRWKIERAGS
jgi:RimJ/RimL family protein N-acetyltransferase